MLLYTMGDIEPLLSFVSKRDKNGVKRLLSQGVSPNCENTDKQAPLEIACRDGYTDIVLLLLGAKADPNIKQTNNLSPLNHSIKMDDLIAVKALLKANASLEEKCWPGGSISLITKSSNHLGSGSEITKLLILHSLGK